jgi:L-asparaginase
MVDGRPLGGKGARPVHLLAAGGTIAMAGDAGGRAVPALDAAAIARAVGLEGMPARTVRTLPGVHLTLADALAVAHAARDELVRLRGRSPQSHGGVVLTTGTDTLEELAVLVEAVCGGLGTVAVTGAIRPAGAPGADGPANVLDAVAVAAHAPAGTWVVFAGEVHAAAEARKADSTSPRCFASPRTGPAGHVAEGVVTMHAAVPAPPALDVAALDLRVPIVPTWLGDDGALVRAAAAGPPAPDGLVVVALGAGHVAPAVLAAVADAAARVPVAACVRPERGALLRATYGFAGAEPDLRAAGVIDAGGRSPQAARVRLLAALGAGLRGAALRAAVEG